MNRPTTRRALIGGACLAAFAGAAAIPAGAAPVAGVSPRLARLMTLRDRADAAFDRFENEVETPAHAAFQAAKAAYPVEAPPPHRSVETTFININDEEMRLGTDGFLASTARKVRDDPTWAGIGEDHPDWRQAHIELAALADERDAVIAAQKGKRQAYEQHARQRLRISEIQKRSDELGRREYSLWAAVINEPVASLIDVTAKLDLIDRLGRNDEDGWVLAAISRDIRTLAQGARA